VPDAAFDAFRVPLAFFAGARRLGARIEPFTPVVAIEHSGGRAVALRVRAQGSGREQRVEADYIVNAAGAWAGGIGALAAVDVPVTPAAGTMVAVRGRLSITGSTQWRAASPDDLVPRPEETASLFVWADAMIPSFSAAPLHAVWTAARPLAGRAGGDTRSASRDFMVLDHAERDGLQGFCTLMGGKATVLRAMAERAADLVCRALGIGEPCRTREARLPSWREGYSDREE
jgi:glycerol-3-phosphate dehydrogenase